VPAKKMKKMLGVFEMLIHTSQLGISRQCVVPAPYSVCQLLGLGSRIFFNLFQGSYKWQLVPSSGSTTPRVLVSSLRTAAVKTSSLTSPLFRQRFQDPGRKPEGHLRHRYRPEGQAGCEHQPG
jgi:hypothetical protein